jgi:hypothetical protein
MLDGEEFVTAVARQLEGLVQAVFKFGGQHGSDFL